MPDVIIKAGAAEPIDIPMPVKVELTKEDAASISKWKVATGDARTVEEIAVANITFATEAMRAQIANHRQSVHATLDLIMDRSEADYKAASEAISNLAANPARE
jgi:hypothetical protein